MPSTTSTSSLDDAVRELSAIPRSEFVARRAALVKELRGAGERELATQVGALRKPSVATWAANAAARRAPDGMRDLVAAVRELQQPGELDVRSATRRLEELLDQLAATARECLHEVGERAGADRAAEVRDLLRVTALSPERAEALLDARLVDDAEAGDADSSLEAALMASAGHGSPRVARTPGHRRRVRDGDDEADSVREEREAAEREEAARHQAERRAELQAVRDEALRVRDEARDVLRVAERDLRAAERGLREFDGD